MKMVTNGRNTSGRFAAGNSGGPGRPKLVTEQAYLAKLSSIVTVKSWAAVCERALADAMAGDARARDWLAKYLMPEPVQRVEMETNSAPEPFLTRAQMIERIQAKLHEFHSQSQPPVPPGGSD